MRPPDGILPPLLPLQLSFLFKRVFSLPLLAWKPAPPGWEPSRAAGRACGGSSPPEEFRDLHLLAVPAFHPQKLPGEQALEAGRCGMKMEEEEEQM